MSIAPLAAPEFTAGLHASARYQVPGAFPVRTQVSDVSQSGSGQTAVAVSRILPTDGYPCYLVTLIRHHAFWLRRVCCCLVACFYLRKTCIIYHFHSRVVLLLKLISLSTLV